MAVDEVLRGGLRSPGSSSRRFGNSCCARRSLLDSNRKARQRLHGEGKFPQ